MALIFGIGSGLFSCGVIWIIGLILCFILSRLGKPGGIFGIVILLVILSIVMSLYPREEPGEEVKKVDTEDIDDFYFPRIIYATLITVFLILAFVAYFIDHILMSNVARAAKMKKTYTF